MLHGVLACSAADGVIVDDGHLLVLHLSAGLDQLAGLLIQGHSLDIYSVSAFLKKLDSLTKPEL